MNNTTDLQQFINMVETGLDLFKEYFKKNETSCLFFTAKKENDHADISGNWLGYDEHIKGVCSHVLLDILMEETPGLKDAIKNPEDESIYDAMNGLFDEISEYMLAEIRGN